MVNKHKKIVFQKSFYRNKHNLNITILPEYFAHVNSPVFLILSAKLPIYPVKKGLLPIIVGNHKHS
jgi:hypothetical protein